MKIWLLLFTLIFSCKNAHAALKWDRLRADLAPVANEKSVETVFAFVNEGPGDVTIEAVKSSCGCTTAVPDKKVYAPGEKGELRARFDIGQRRGPQSKTISVKVQNEPMPTILTLAVALPEPLKITPALVVWEKGAEAKGKTMTIAAQPGRPIQSLKVTSSDARMHATAEAKDGGYVINVTPGATDTAGFATLTIEAQTGGTTQTLRAYAQIKPAAK